MFPVINPGEPNVASMGDAVDGDTIDNGFRLSDTLTWIRGKHQFEIRIRAMVSTIFASRFRQRQWDFQFFTAGNRGHAGHSQPEWQQLASLLGAPDFSNYLVKQTQPRWLRSYFAGFVQDDFKINPSLTVNLGLRYEIDQPFKEANRNYADVSLTAPNPAWGNAPGACGVCRKGNGTRW